jgi:hypothetical protein
MAVQQVTTGPTEGELEAEIHGALKIAFPWLPPGSVQHQTTFSFSFGAAVVHVDGAKRDKAKARADILLRYNSRGYHDPDFMRGDAALGAPQNFSGTLSGQPSPSSGIEAERG